MHYGFIGGIRSGDAAAAAEPEPVVVPSEPEPKPVPLERGTYKAFFYKDDNDTWVVDEERRKYYSLLLQQHSVALDLGGADIERMIDITRPRRLAPGEVYTPSAKLLARIAAEKATEKAEDERRRAANSGTTGYPSSGSSKGESSSGGKGYGYSPK
ncbi:MAG: hypothetical protein ACYDHP_14480 [Ferrimicrobium sp.]